MVSGCHVCEAVGHLDHPVLQTPRWVVDLGSNAAYFGRAYVTLREHKRCLSELDDVDWQDLREVVLLLERTYADLFDADPLNWACLMNNAFRDGGDDPHVHWHVFPRYRTPVEFEGETYRDLHYGEHYDPMAERIMDEAAVARLAARLKDYLQHLR